MKHKRVFRNFKVYYFESLELVDSFSVYNHIKCSLILFGERKMSNINRLPTLSFGANMRLPLILKYWKFIDSTNVLEIGCGQERLSARLSNLSNSYTCCEPDPESYAFVSTLLPENKIILGTSRDLPPKSLFSAIFSSEVLEHIEDDDSEVKNWNALLPINAKLIITVPAHPKLYSRVDKRVGHHWRYTKETLSKLFLENGFKIEILRQFGGVASLILLLCQNFIATFDNAEEKSELEKKLESGRWYQSKSSSWHGIFIRKIFTFASKIPPRFGSSYLLVATKDIHN